MQDGCQPSDDAMAVKESFQESAFSSVEDNTTVDIRPSSASSFEVKRRGQSEDFSVFFRHLLRVSD